jgi:hypothetical protein
MEHPVDFIGGARLPAKAKDLIMGGNAARLLKIDYNTLTRRRSE